jgi:hypothetical protein
MKILFDDKARTATITALYETLEYPASNLADIFLNRPYIGMITEDVITLTMAAEVAVDSVFLAGCNCAFVHVELFDDADVSLYSVTKNVLRPVETVYFTSVMAKKVVLTMDLDNGIAPWVLGYRGSILIKRMKADPTITAFDGNAVTYTGGNLSFDYTVAYENVKLKGVGFGASDKFSGALWARNRARASTTTAVRSPMGQVMRNKGAVLRSYTLTVPNLNMDDFRDLDETLMTLDKDYPVYIDITEDTDGSEDPIYATVDDNWSVSDRGREQDISIPILEAR